MAKNDTLVQNAELQAKIFGEYLISQTPHTAAIEQYVQLAHIADYPLNKNDEKLLLLALKHPKLIGTIDAGLVFVNPMSEVRRRIYVMLAILECQPEYTSYFLPTERPRMYILFVIYAAARGVIKSLLGIAIIKVVA